LTSGATIPIISETQPSAMNEKTKLILALQQIDNVTSLLEGNEYEKFLCGQLISVKVELKRQLRNLGTKNGNV